MSALENSPSQTSPIIAPSASTTDAASTPAVASAPANVDVQWVWREVRKRVFIKLPFSMGVADALEAVKPITMDGDHFVVGLPPRDYPLSSHLTTTQVHNTIENILRQAAGRPIHFEVVEGTTLDDWQVVRERRSRAQAAVMAMAEQQAEAHHFEDVLNQIVSEIRQRVTSSRDRVLPQVRAGLVLDVVPSLADAEDMLFPDPNSHDARRAMARAIDRVASFLEVTPVLLAIEVERYRREHHQHYDRPGPNRASDVAETQQPAATSAEPRANSNA
jgi:hypothetical protein